MKFSEKIYFKIILKVTKNQGSTLSIEGTFFKKPQAGGRGGQFEPPSRLGLTKPLNVRNFYAELILVVTMMQ